MAKPRLSLDADASSRTLQRDLQERGHDVTRTPTEWMPPDASDEMQLLDTTAHGRSIFTFNIGDFVRLAQRYPEHRGIILANQRDWILASLIGSLDRLLTDT
jgi:hypothetical protein